jgi:hypothetical protein
VCPLHCLLRREKSLEFASKQHCIWLGCSRVSFSLSRLMLKKGKGHTIWRIPHCNLPCHLRQASANLGALPFVYTKATRLCLHVWVMQDWHAQCRHIIAPSHPILRPKNQPVLPSILPSFLSYGLAIFQYDAETVESVHLRL